MRSILMIAALLCSTVANATSFSSTAIFSTDYIFRGLSYSKHSPVLQGTFDVYHDGYSIGFFTGPVHSFNLDKFEMQSDMEFDTFVAYTKSFDDLILSGGFNTYMYMRNQTNHMIEVAAHATWKDLKLNVGYINDLVHLGTSVAYNQLVWTPNLSDEIRFVSHIAYTHFSNPEVIAGSNYMDYKAGISYATKDFWYVELFYTNTLFRRDLTTDVAPDDAAINLTVMKTFTWLANK